MLNLARSLTFICDVMCFDPAFLKTKIEGVILHDL